MAAEGYGHRLTTNWLIETKVPAFTQSKPGRRKKGGRWSMAYVGYILRDRRALGEFQPHSRGKPDGDPLPNYYPAVVTEEQWLRARAGAAQRIKNPGRVSRKHVNVFAGLVRDAIDGGNYFASLRPGSKGSSARRVLVNPSYGSGRGSLLSFPLETFERAILSAIKELDPRDILPRPEGQDDATTIADEIGGVDAELDAAAAFMEAEGFSPTIGKRVTDLETRRSELATKLLAAKARATCTPAEAWKDFGSLVSVLENAPNPPDARMRLRSALRRLAEGIWLLVVPRGHDRLAAAQIWFAGGQEHRDYLILHRPPRSNGKTYTEGRWAVRSLASVAASGDLDLRQLEDARLLAEALTAWDLSSVPADGDDVQ
jgi:hypothetical protein